MGQVYRFGPLGSVIPYSCVLVDLCIKQYKVSIRPPVSTSSLPFFFFSKWARSSFYISRGYHMPFSLSKLDCSSLHKWTEIGTVPVRLPFRRDSPYLPPLSPESGATWDDGCPQMTRPVSDRSFLSTTRQPSNMHVCPSSCNILPVMVRMKPGINLTKANVPSLRDNTLAPA